MFEWANYLADLVAYKFLGLEVEGHWGQAVHFFVYDVLKIIFLLFLITFLMGLVNSYFPIERIRSFLTRHRFYGLDYFLASMFGAITPFCSCSSVPLFIGFVRGGIPLGITFAFLITSPLVNEVALAMFLGVFGWKLTLAYALSGIFLGAFAGWVLGSMNLEAWLSPWVRDLLNKAGGGQEAEEELRAGGMRQRLKGITKESWGIIKSVWIYVVIGIGFGAMIHGFVPSDFFEAYISRENILAVPIATLLAIPLYSNAAGVVPIIQVLVAKGIPIGTALAFMMATIGLSLPEATLLKKVMTGRLIVVFFALVAFCIMLIGYFFNLFFLNQ